MGKNYLIVVVLCLLTTLLPAQNRIYVSDFGVKADSYKNATPTIRKAIESAKIVDNAVIVLPHGRIDLWPDAENSRELYISNCTEDDTLSKFKNIAFLLENHKNLSIEGENTLIVLHDKMIAFALLNCENIQIKNISFDYERPTMSELKITEISANEMICSIHPDSKYRIDNGRILFYSENWKMNAYHCISFSHEWNTMKYSSFKPLLESIAEQLDSLKVKFKGKFNTASYHKGDVLTVRDPYRDNCGAFINQSKDIRLENINMYFMHGLGIVSQFSENISLNKVNVAPRENSGRYIAAFADCFHFSGCKGKVIIDSCVCIGSHDDPVNVHGTHLQITEINKNKKKLKLRFMHHQTFGFPAFYAGDSIAFVNSQTLMPLAYARLKNAALINKREMEVETEDALPDSIKISYCVENISWTPEVHITNSRFERCNTRGLLLTSRRKIVVENNRFYRLGMQAVLIADDASSWYESGAVKDVIIRNNQFIECGYNSAPDNYIIAIAPENHELHDGNMVHQNIRIEGNTFVIYDYPVLSVRSTSNLKFNANTITSAGNFMKLRPNEAPAFKLTACKNVKLLFNKSTLPYKPSILLEKMTTIDIRTDIGINEIRHIE